MNSTGRLATALPAVEPPPSLLRGRRYGEDRLYLLVRDPRCVLTVWELTPATHARAMSAARARGASPRYQIRIERRGDPRGPADPRGAVEAVTSVDLADALGGERWYMNLPRSGGECRALLGFSVEGAFTALLESTWVPVPPDGPCAEEGAWDLTAEARTWLLERARAGRDPEHARGSAPRYAAPDRPETHPR